MFTAMEGKTHNSDINVIVLSIPLIIAFRIPWTGATLKREKKIVRFSLGMIPFLNKFFIEIRIINFNANIQRNFGAIWKILYEIYREKLVLLLALCRYLLSQFLRNEIYISVVASSLRYGGRSTIRKVKISFLLRAVYSTTKRRGEETFQFRKAIHCKRRRARNSLKYAAIFRILVYFRETKQKRSFSEEARLPWSESRRLRLSPR